MAAGLCGALAQAEDLMQLKPMDEAGRDKGLVALLERIRLMTAHRDFRGLESLMLPTFRVEFDVGKGPAAFRSHWRPEAPASRLWQVLPRLFALGGTFYSNTLFAVPYVYTRFPGDLSLLGHVVALKEDVSLFEKPEPGAKRVAAAPYSIVPLAAALKPPVLPATGHLEARLPGAGSCFVAADDVYSPAAHRAFFEKRQGQWRWISLAAATLADPPIPKGSVSG
jgi:hypothetical protein